MTALAERSASYPPPLLAMGPWCGDDLPAADPAGPSKYYRARYYDPEIGRFVSEDPIKWFGGMNLFGYVHNHPTNFVDPFGLRDGPPALRRGDVGMSGPPPGVKTRPPAVDFVQVACGIGNGRAGGLLTVSIAPGTGAIVSGGPGWGCGCGATINTILQGEAPDPEGVRNFLTGLGASAGGFKILGGQVSISKAGVALGVGAGLGGFGGGAGTGVEIPQCRKCPDEEFPFPPFSLRGL